MDFNALVNTEQFLKDDTIKVYFREGVLKAPAALRLYFLGKMRFEYYYESKEEIAPRLDMPIGTIKSACKELADQGFIYQDRFKSRIEQNGKVFYRRLWHFGRPQNQVNFTQTGQLGTQELGGKVNPTSEENRTLKGGVRRKTEPHTLEEDKLKEDNSIVRANPGTIEITHPLRDKIKEDTFRKGGNKAEEKEGKRIPNRIDIDQYYHHRRPEEVQALLKRRLPDINEWRLCPDGKNKTYPDWFATAFHLILYAYGFDGWNHDPAKDSHAAWALYKNIHPSWLNRRDLVGAMLSYAEKMVKKAVDGTFRVEDLWMNNVKDALEPVLNKELDPKVVWSPHIVTNLDIMNLTSS